MDPIQAWKKQQERLGQGEKTVKDLSNSQPRWAASFEMSDKDKDGELSSFEECELAFKRIQGGGDVEIPQRKLKEFYEKESRDRSGKLGFREFYQVVAETLKFMAMTPKWKGLEEDARDREELQNKALLRHQRATEAMDMYNILGIKRETSEVQKKYERKETRDLKIGQDTSSSLFKSSAEAMINQKTVSREPVEGVVTRGTGFRDQRKRHTIDTAADLQWMRSLDSPGAACYMLQFSGDGTYLAGAFYDGALRIYHTDLALCSSCLQTLNLSPKARKPKSDDSDSVPVKPAAWTPKLASRGAAMTNLRWRPTGDDRIIATVTTEGSIGLWKLRIKGSVETPDLLADVSGKHSLTAVSFSNDGGKLLVGGSEKVVKVYDLENGIYPGNERILGSTSIMPGRIDSHTMKIMSIRAVPETSDAYISGGMDKHVMLWDLRVTCKRPVLSFSGPLLAGDAMDISRDGFKLLTGSHESSHPLRLYDIRKLADETTTSQCRGRSLTDGACTHYEWNGDEAEKGKACLLFAAAWDSNTNRTIVAAGEKENMARVFQRPRDQCDFQTPLKVLRTFDSEDSGFFAAAISSNGRNAAFGSGDGTVIITDLSKKLAE